MGVEHDDRADARVSITATHSRVHDGKSFGISILDATMSTNDVLTIGLKTPSDLIKLHLVHHASTSGAGKFEILEGSTLTAGSGSALPIYNKDRNSSNASKVKDISTIPPTVNSATLWPTIGAVGTIIFSTLIGAGTNKSSGESRGILERILKADTQYVFRLTALANSNRGTLAIDWYEEG